MSSYKKIIGELERLLGHPRPPAKRPGAGRGRATLAEPAGRALIFSPHPDDESIVGGLALRLLQEAKISVANVAVTLGSKPSRRAARLKELKAACVELGFGLVLAGERGLDGINLKARQQFPDAWADAVGLIAWIMSEVKPSVIFLPHAHDGHATHIGTHQLVMEALKQSPRSFSCFVVETEFWGQMADPNLLVEISGAHLAQQMTALALHVGEVKRNPYHLRLPAWMMDNVRRAELVTGPGSTAPKFAFGTMYRLSRWHGGKLARAYSGGKILPCSQSVSTLFR